MKNSITNASVLKFALAAGLLMYGCSEDESGDITPQTPNCVPKEIPVFAEDFTAIQPEYDDQSKITGFQYMNGENLDTSMGMMKVAFSESGKLTKVQTYASYYYFLEYEEGKIIEKEGDHEDPDQSSFEDDRFFVYLLDDQDRIIKKEEHDIDNGVEEIEYVETYTYDDHGNIIKIIEEDLVDGETTITHIEYDDHPNPFHTLGFFISDDGLFNLFSLSKNNPVKILEEQDEDYVVSFEYTYDEEGNPTDFTYTSRYLQKLTDSEGNLTGETQEVVNTEEYSFAYECK